MSAIGELIEQLDDIADGHDDTLGGIGIHQLGDGGITMRAFTNDPAMNKAMLARALANLLRGEQMETLPLDALDTPELVWWA